MENHDKRSSPEKVTLDEALKSLPHGAGFRFIDRLIELIPGVSGSGEFLLPKDHASLPGHFPGNPLMPGVLMVEALAQLAGVVAQSDPTRPPLLALKLTGIRQVKINGSIRPGQTLTIEAQISGRMGGLIQARGSVSSAGQVLLHGEVTLSGSEPVRPVDSHQANS